MLHYLPNQLGAVLGHLAEATDAFTAKDAAALESQGEAGRILLRGVEDVRARAKVEARVLEREVEALRRKAEQDEASLSEEEKRTVGYGMVAAAGHAEDRAMKRGSVGCDGVG